MEKNVGNLDAALRVLLGIFLLWLVLFSMKGIEGNLWGILIAVIAIAPVTFSITRKCPVFHFFNISSIPKKK